MLGGGQYGALPGRPAVLEVVLEAAMASSA